MNTQIIINGSIKYIYADSIQWVHFVTRSLHRNDNDLPAAEYKNGDKFWYVNGIRHRDNDRPATEYANGNKHWYVNGKLHRDGGLPAIVYANGDKSWYINDKLHRIDDLPAIEFVNGDKRWYNNNNKLHRLGGLPAVENIHGYHSWAIFGKLLTYDKICNYYKILARFGRYCLKKIRMKKLRRLRWIHNELLCMPAKGSYPGGQDYHQMVSYFMNM
jgi:hypothetical protein